MWTQGGSSVSSRDLDRCALSSRPMANVGSHDSPPIAADDVGSRLGRGDEAADVPGGPSVQDATADAVTVWEGQAQIDIAGLIDHYLEQQPSPGRSRHAALYRHWAAELRESGEARLAALADRRRLGAAAH